MVGIDGPDAYAKPPPAIKTAYKKFQKLDTAALKDDADILDMTRHDDLCPQTRQSTLFEFPSDIRQAFSDFLGSGDDASSNLLDDDYRPRVFEVVSVPGLYIFPSVLPKAVQLRMLDKLFLRDLCNPKHKTNVHMHHEVPYPRRSDDGYPLSYFDSASSSLVFQPKDSSIHKPVTTSQYLNRKLRWMTLGGQYDWTNKIYPAGPPPAFPEDTKALIESVFPMKAEAAIVNLYSPGDTLSLHRDVSEECDQPLVSISLGCDGIFIAGLEGTRESEGARVAVMRLRSGDAVLMSGESRYAWHGVPKVLEGTCPDWMKDWPGISRDGEVEGRFAQWKGWMAGKRINLNVRQMFA